MRRFFIDTSVFFPAIHSSRGNARDLFILAGQELVQLVVSDWVLAETRHNLADFAPDRVEFLDYLLSRLLTNYSYFVRLATHSITTPKAIIAAAAGKTAKMVERVTMA